MCDGKNITLELNHEEKQIIEMIRDINYGEIVVMMKDGKPVRVEIRRSVCLK